MKEAYVQGEESEIDQETSDQIKPKDVGHNIFILAHQVTFRCLMWATKQVCVYIRGTYSRKTYILLC